MYYRDGEICRHEEKKPSLPTSGRKIVISSASFFYKGFLRYLCQSMQLSFVNTNTKKPREGRIYENNRVSRVMFNVYIVLQSR